MDLVENEVTDEAALSLANGLSSIDALVVSGCSLTTNGFKALFTKIATLSKKVFNIYVHLRVD